MTRNEYKSRAVAESLGVTFGKLTVVEFSGCRITPRGRKVPHVFCVCDCGREKVVSLWDVRSGKTKTCGLNHPHYEDRSRPAFNQIYRHSYKKRALDAGLEFELTEEQFRYLSQEPCHYCGSPPCSEYHRGERGKRPTGNGFSQFIYNGLDRVDSSAGYTLDNVVPCCAICNHAKHTMSYEDFTEWLGRIVEFRTGAVTRAKRDLVLVSVPPRS